MKNDRSYPDGTTVEQDEDGYWVVNTPLGQRGGRWVHYEDARGVALLPDANVGQWAAEAAYWRDLHAELLEGVRSNYENPAFLMALCYRQTAGRPGSPEQRRYVQVALDGLRRRSSTRGD